MHDESRRNFLIRYAAMALAAAKAARAQRRTTGRGQAARRPGPLTKDVYGPPPSPYQLSIRSVRLRWRPSTARLRAPTRPSISSVRPRPAPLYGPPQGIQLDQ